MARISTYALDNSINDGDKLIGTDADNNNITKNFTLSGIADYVIDTLIDPDATDFHIPVFNQNGIRITDSIMHQDSSVSNGKEGALITIDGNLLVNNNATVYLNLSVAGESYLLGNVYLGTTSADTINQRGTLEMLGPVVDSNGNLGGDEQVLVSNASGRLSWENYQGTGLEFQGTWDPFENTPDLFSVPLIPGNTGKYWVASREGSTPLSGITQWSAGDWAIISQDENDNVFWSKIDNSSVDGLGETDKLTYWDSSKTLTFASNIVVTDSGLTLGSVQNPGTLNLTGQAPEITIGDGFKIRHALGGIAEISETGSGDLHIYSDNEVQIKSGVLGETFAKFKKDGPIELYYDNTKVFSTIDSGINVTGTKSVFGGNVLVAGDVNSQGTLEGERLLISTGPSTLTGDVTFEGPITIEDDVSISGTVDMNSGTIENLGDPTEPQEAATKAYVDAGFIGTVTGGGNNLTVPMWAGNNTTSNLANSSITLRLVDPGNLNDYGLQFGGFSQATGQRNSVAIGYSTTASNESTFASGYNTTASGSHAASFNFLTTASGDKSAAFGNDTIASGTSSFAIGNDTLAATSLAFAGGLNSTANPSLNGTTAFAYGNALNITGQDAAGFGKGNTATGRRNFVVGSNNQVAGDNSFSIGALNVITIASAVAIGSGNNISRFGSFAIGERNVMDKANQTAALGYFLQAGSKQYQTIVGYNNVQNDDASFVVGAGQAGSRTNGLEVYGDKVVLPEYGNGNITDTAAYNLSVTPDGKIVETPDRKYVSLITQAGATAPTIVTNFVNNLTFSPGSFVGWTYLGPGEYNLEITGAFDVDRTVVFINGGSAENNHNIAWEVIDSDNLVIRTHSSNDRLTKASLEIRTY